MKKSHALLFFLFAIFTFVGCSPSDSSSNSDDDFAHNFGNTVNRSFIGQIVDTDNHPLENVTVEIGTSTVQTDVNGIFIINDASVHEKFAYIKATKAGYIDGSRSIVPTAGKNKIKIMLISNTPLQTIQSGVASEVALSTGTKVNFDGAFQDENGASYTGAVQVSMFHLTTSDENLSSLMPGMLYAQRENGSEAVLETFGMLNVELRGSAGQKLNIANGHTAQITIKIDDSQTTTAPSSIPLWHFDNAKGYWKEDGVATKIGNKYVGTVSHFSWWNYDIPNVAILLTINVTDSFGNALPYISIQLLDSNNQHSSGFTDNNGQLSGYIPENEILTLNIVDYICSTGIIYNATIGPFTADTVLPTIVLDSGTVQSCSITGTLVKCTGEPVTNGYVRLLGSSHFAYADVTNGSFSWFEAYCPGDTEFNLEGIDFDEAKRTNSINYNFTTPVINIGNLPACNTINEYVYFKINNNTARLLSYQTQGVQTSYGFSVYGYDPGTTFNIYGTTTTPGTYTTNEFHINTTGLIIDSSTPNTIQFNLTEYGSVGQYIEMTFSGNYTTDGLSKYITGKVHVLRDN